MFKHFVLNHILLVDHTTTTVSMINLTSYHEVSTKHYLRSQAIIEHHKHHDNPVMTFTH